MLEAPLRDEWLVAVGGRSSPTEPLGQPSTGFRVTAGGHIGFPVLDVHVVHTARPSHVPPYSSVTKTPQQGVTAAQRVESLRQQPIAAQRARNARLLAQAQQIAHAVEVADGLAATPVTVVPANTRETVLLPDDTRQIFLDRLERTLARAFDDTARPPDVATVDSAEVAAALADVTTPITSPALLREAAILGRSCATCRGECCTAGGDHAFLREDSLRRMRAQHPDRTAAHHLQAYADLLPARHYRGSCVYHTTDGCALPRDMRANICNRYVCGGLTLLKRAMQAAGGATPVFVASADSVHLRRMALIDADGMRSIPLTSAD